MDLRRISRPPVARWIAKVFAAGCLAMSVTFTHVAFASSSTNENILLELNKLEQQDSACQVYLLVTNATESQFDDLKLDLVIFDIDLVVMRRVAVELAPLRAGKSSVKSFKLTGESCSKVGRFLLNGFLTCGEAGQKRSDCIDMSKTSSRTDVAFID